MTLSLLTSCSYLRVRTVDFIEPQIILKDFDDAVLYGTAKWFHNVRGIVSNPAAYFADPFNPYVGVIIITKQSIYFAQWHHGEQRYGVLFGIPIKDITTLEFEKYGFNLRIVIKTAESKHQSFSMTKSIWTDADRQKTEETYQLLRELTGLQGSEIKRFFRP